MLKFLSDLYHWYWSEYRCRLEPYTYEWRRYVARYWWVVLIKTGISIGLFLWMLLFPLAGISSSWRIAIIVIGACGMVFFAWLLLHLGHFAGRLLQKIRGH